MSFLRYFDRQFLAVITTLLLTCAAGQVHAQEWYVGHWVPDVERTLGRLDHVDKEVRDIVGAIELVIDEKNIYNIAWGASLSRHSYEIVKLSDSSVLLKAKNGFGMTEKVIERDGRHIKVIPRIEYDKYGPFKPANPIITYYIRSGNK